MLCALADKAFDADRAYDTYVRIGGEKEKDGSAIIYSSEKDDCIGESGLTDLQIFLEKHLKGREIFIPSSLNLSVQEESGELHIEATSDEDAIVEEMGIYYAETDLTTRSCYREWKLVHQKTGIDVKKGKIEYTLTPYEDAPAAFVYAYARYLNGFKITSKIVVKELEKNKGRGVRSRMLFSGENLDCFSVANTKGHSIAGIFLDETAKPRLINGYGNLQGVYSAGGVKTYRIGSPRYVAKDGAMLKFDAYSRESGTLTVCVEVVERNGEAENYFCRIPIKGGGKWKRIILASKDFKNEKYGRPLSSFSQGSALSFCLEDVESEYAVANLLWL